MRRMIRKSVLSLVIVGIVCCFNSIVNPILETSGEFQNIKTDITDIKWKWIEDYSDENKSAIEITTNATVNNPNGPIELVFPTYPEQMFGTNASINLKNEKLTFRFKCYCSSIFPAEMNETIPAGERKITSVSYLFLDEGGIEIIPDGTYILWLYLYGYGETMLNSTRALMRIRNGVPSFDFSYVSTINISITSKVIFGLIISALIMLVIHFKRKK